MSDEILHTDKSVLDPEQVKSIETAFSPKVIERENYAKVYDNLLSKPLTPEVCQEARNLRLKLVKVRTGIADIHKTQKAFFLAAGRLVDSWKNKETKPVKQMEEKLSEIEDHFAKIERERIKRIHDQRLTQLKQYSPLSLPDNLGQMDQETFERLLDREKRSFEYEEEQKRAKEEEERLAAQKKQLGIDRRELALPYYHFWTNEEKDLDFSEVSESDFNSFIDRVKSEKETKDKKDEELRRISEIRNSRINEISPYIHFVRDYEALLSMTEDDYHKELKYVKRAAEEHFEFEQKEKQRVIDENKNRELKAVDFLKDEGFVNSALGMSHSEVGFVSKNSYDNLKDEDELIKFKEDVLKTKRIELLRISQEKAQEELDKKLAEEKKLADEKYRLRQIELSKGDEEKLNDLKSDLKDIKSKFSFDSEINKQMYSDVCILIDNIIEQID